MMGLLKPVIKTHIISYVNTQYSSIPQFHHSVQRIKKIA